MKVLKHTASIILASLLLSACSSRENPGENIRKENHRGVDKVQEPNAWKSDLLSSRVITFPLPSIREKAIDRFIHNPLSEGHELLVVAHMNDNRIIFQSTDSDSDSSKYDEKHLYGWVYNEISDSIMEQKWDVENIKKISEWYKEYVLYNILFPYNEQGINEIENVIVFIYSEFEEFSLSYLAAYNDYYVLSAFEKPHNTTYNGLRLYIDYEGNLLEVEKYKYDRNTNCAEFIEYLDMRSSEIKGLSRDQALELLKSFVELLDGQDFGDGSIREIGGREYYLFTVFSEYTVDGGYCVDLITGELYSSDEQLVLTPLSN